MELPVLPEGSQWERNVLIFFAGGKFKPVTYKSGTILYRAVPSDWIEILPTNWK